MERHSFAMEIKKGKMNDYRKKLGEIWPELTTFLDRNQPDILERHTTVGLLLLCV